MTLAITMGDPAGVGGEIIAGAWRALRETGPDFVVLADPDWLAAYAPTGPAGTGFAAAIPVIPVPLAATARPGQPDSANAPAIIASIEQAVRLAQAGRVAGVVTSPISKAVLTRAGFPHPGHTEFLAALTGAAGKEVMMLASPLLRVVPVTIHVSLRVALDQLSTARILDTSRATHAALRRDFGIAAPRLAMAGLNPHAGESGTMGTEETTLIQPAIDVLRREGMLVSGPHPPDTMFTQAARRGYDAAICHYHDQALIPLKTLDMWGRGECHARPADRAHLARSWHRVRHCRAGHRRPREHDRRDQAGGGNRATSRGLGLGWGDEKVPFGRQH